MVLAINRPMKRSGSSFEQFRKRTPSDVLKVARGKRATISLTPERPGDDPVLVSITIGSEVRFSLQTREPALAKRRNASATEQLERIYKTLLDGPRPLIKKQRIAIAGLLYRAFAETLEGDPGDPELWRQVQEANDEALNSTPLTIDTFPGEGRQRLLERRFGGLVDLILQREGIVTDTASRSLLLEEAGQALNDAAKKLAKNANSDYSPYPSADRFPKWEGIKPIAPAPSPPASLTFDNLLDRWERESAKAPSSLVGFRQHVRAFKEHLEHNDVKRVTRSDVIAWKDALLSHGLAAKTINGSYLATIRTLYRLARRNDLIATDPTDGIGVQSKRKAGEGRLPYDDAEVGAILALADAQTDARLRWIPWLLALTGARVGEIAQLWGNRVVTVNGVPIIRIAPANDGGTIKNAGSERDVALHPAIINRGFLEFVETRPNGGPLFYGGKEAIARPRKSKTAGHASDGAINRVREWIRENGFADPRKAPSHAFRHWFKTKCAELDIPDSVADAIQGHSDQSAAAGYRKISLAKMADAICKIPVPEISDRYTNS